MILRDNLSKFLYEITDFAFKVGSRDYIAVYDSLIYSTEPMPLSQRPYIAANAKLSSLLRISNYSFFK